MNPYIETFNSIAIYLLHTFSESDSLTHVLYQSLFQVALKRIQACFIINPFGKVTFKSKLLSVCFAKYTPSQINGSLHIVYNPNNYFDNLNQYQNYFYICEKKAILKVHHIFHQMELPSLPLKIWCT